MSKHISAQEPGIPCCPELTPDDHCDVINFSRVLTYPTATLVAGRRNVVVEVILRFRFSRCTLGLVLGDPVYSTTLLPGEKVRLSTTDRRSTFSYDSETKLSYRSEQISEEQYYMSAVQKYMADASAAQSGEADSSSEGKWDFHGDASGSVNPFSLSASASTNAKGSHNSHSTFDYLNQQRSHMESAASQAAEASRKTHAVSIGEVSSRTHIEGESQDHFEASSREFSNLNKCHAVTYMFYRLNKKQRIKFELVAIERRVLDENAPVGGVLKPGAAKLPVALVPQDIPATIALNRTAEAVAAGRISTLSVNTNLSGLFEAPRATAVAASGVKADTGSPIDDATRTKALKEVDEQLAGKGLIDKTGKVGNEIKRTIEFEAEFSLPTPGIIVKGCLDECDVCEPLLKERLQLENDLLRKQIELLEKSQEYRCCPVAKDDGEDA
ncbi:hypothetical protein [Niabella hirudinis]|uniref:hypothetical protein n=1 Tax=Niabella hirudinis TaxID=1285929 RepID=UPI003EBFED42